MDYNRFVLSLLDSPLHVLLSGSVMRLAFTGRKSGTQYSTPVNYVHETMADGSERYWTMSDRKRTWWRNLRGGAPVTLGMRRTPIAATGYLIEEPAAVEETLKHYLDLAPGLARVLHVPRQAGVLDADALRRAAQKQVIVYFTPRPGHVAQK